MKITLSRRRLSLARLLAAWGAHEGRGRWPVALGTWPASQRKARFSRLLQALKAKGAKRLEAELEVALIFRAPLIARIIAAGPESVQEARLHWSDDVPGLLRVWDGRLIGEWIIAASDEEKRFADKLSKKQVLADPLLAVAASLSGPFLLMDGTHRAYRWISHPCSYPLRLGVVLVRSLEQWGIP